MKPSKSPETCNESNAEVLSSKTAEQERNDSQDENKMINGINTKERYPEIKKPKISFRAPCLVKKQPQSTGMKS